MRRTIIALIAVALTGPAAAQVHVNGYTKSDGTYVAPHYRSSPDSSVYNNYSTRGNVNPYTGAVGTVDPNPTYQPYVSPYGSSSYTPPKPVCYSYPCPR